MDGVPPQRDPLALDKEAMRQLGYRTVDLLVEWLERESPAIRRASPAEMRKRLAGPPPEQAEPFEAILEGLERDVLPFASRDGHPRFFGFIPSRLRDASCGRSAVARASVRSRCWRTSRAQPR